METTASPWALSSAPDMISVPIQITDLETEEEIMATIVITGASRGLGLEFVRQYAADGDRVIAACRHPDKATALKAIKGDVRVVALDIADAGSIHALAETLGIEPIDIVINNAGVYGKAQSLSKTDYAAWEDVFRINTIGPLHLTDALLPRLAAGKRKLVVAITSLMGSIADNSSGGYYAYRSSKAGLNAVFKSLSVDLKPSGVTAVVLHPGWVKTDMGGANAPLEPKDSVSGMRAVISKLDIKDSGRFLDFRGKELPW
jgi:NAD(P)-dependent dehydrogenase (short-subunit alcohol dehydrogenase family)